MTLPPRTGELLRTGTLCYLAAPSSGGPHVTPVVFVQHGRRVWATTSRGAVKSAVWRRNPVAGGMIRVGDEALVFRGAVSLYDALDPGTWPRSVLRAMPLGRASTRFTLKNARFFAGYARDARRVPLSWTPPGRIVVSVDLDAGAVVAISSGEIGERWGTWRSALQAHRSYRASRSRPFPDGQLPPGLSDLLAEPGDAVMGVEGPAGPTVLPARWARADGAYLAVLPRSLLELSSPGTRGALVVDRASSWRAARMAGLLLRGDIDVFLLSEVRTGGRTLWEQAKAAGPLPQDAAVVRLRPSSAAWWLGWSSGTVVRR